MESYSNAATPPPTMPSLFKKLLYGKDLSNPYCNPYHPGHISTDSQPGRSNIDNSFLGVQPHPTSLNRTPNKQTHTDPTAAYETPPASASRPPHPRPDSPSHLEEARRMAGRDPITGRPIARPPSTNPGPAVSPPPPTTQPSSSFRSDVLLRDQRRRREEKEALQQAQRELGGYFSPVIVPVGRRR